MRWLAGLSLVAACSAAEERFEEVAVVADIGPGKLEVAAIASATAAEIRAAEFVAGVPPRRRLMRGAALAPRP